MVKVILSLAVGLAAGFAIALLTGPTSEPAATSGFTADSGFGGTAGDDAALGRRIAALETALAAERAARETLEASVAALAEQSPQVSVAGGPGAAEDNVGVVEFGPGGAAFVAGGRPGRFPGQIDLGDALLEVGFSPERSQLIQDRIEELQLEALQARYDAARDGEPGRSRGVRNFDQLLREELGESDYDLYRQATGRPTAIEIGDVLSSSPAEQAGFRPGDRIVSYAGERVYDINELNRLTFGGESGESVVVEVQRDGQTIQLYLPRGPLGITSGPGLRRPRL